MSGWAQPQKYKKVARLNRQMDGTFVAGDFHTWKPGKMMRQRDLNSVDSLLLPDWSMYIRRSECYHYCAKEGEAVVSKYKRCVEFGRGSVFSRRVVDQSQEKAWANWTARAGVKQ